MRVQRVQRGEEKNTARNASQWRCALSRCSSFVFMLSLDSGEKAPVFSFELREFVRFTAESRFGLLVNGGNIR